eukprot:4309646-Pleurochrysis_carterae.AAC.1
MTRFCCTDCSSRKVSRFAWVTFRMRTSRTCAWSTSAHRSRMGCKVCAMRRRRFAAPSAPALPFRAEVLRMAPTGGLGTAVDRWTGRYTAATSFYAQLLAKTVYFTLCKVAFQAHATVRMQ